MDLTPFQTEENSEAQTEKQDVVAEKETNGNDLTAKVEDVLALKTQLMICPFRCNAKLSKPISWHLKGR